MSPVAPVALRVLIVEDERELGRVLCDYLSETGHYPQVAGTAEAALDLLRREPPDAVVLDVKLPGMSGLEFLGLQPVRESPVPIIVVSGYVTEEQARECLRLGALEFLAKPVPLKVLGAVLEHVAGIGRPSGPPAGSRERRGASRIAVTLPLRVTTEEGDVAAGVAIEISATGLRARVDRALRPGAAARLSVALPDGGAPVDALALVVRSDGEHMAAFWFLDLTATDVARLFSRATAAR